MLCARKLCHSYLSKDRFLSVLDRRGSRLSITNGVETTGFTLWFTGLSGAGKSTLASLMDEELRRRGLKVEVLDGDVVRTNLSKGLGFSKEDRDTNIRRIGFVCHLLSRNDVVAIGAAISPYRSVRDEVRAQNGRFVEVFVRCSVEVCIERDTKGLYKRALKGEIPNFTGISDPYEEPLAPEVVVETDQETPEKSVKRIVTFLEQKGYIPAAQESKTVYSTEDEEVVKDRLKALGYL
jgi:adenylyl-sulfate kinase